MLSRALGRSIADESSFSAGMAGRGVTSATLARGVAASVFVTPSGAPVRHSLRD